MRSWYSASDFEKKTILDNVQRHFRDEHNRVEDEPHSVLQARGGFRGGRGRTPPPPLRDSTLCRPKGSPFDTFSEIHFWPTDPKIFLKAPSATICTNFEGERAPKKRDFFVKFFQKVHKNGFFDCFFFKNLPAAQKI